MNYKSTRNCFALGKAVLSALCTFTASSASAADNFWSSLSSNTWDTTTSNWSISPRTWNNSNIDNAIFTNSGSRLINVQSPITLSAIAFTGDGYKISGPQTLTFTSGGGGSYAQGEMRVDTGASADISAPIVANLPLTKTGAGKLILYNNANISTISEGTLQIGKAGLSGSLTGNVTNNGTLRFEQPNSFTYSGNVNGSGSLIKAGSGSLTLTGVNSYSGGTIVSSGKLFVGNSGNSGSIIGDISVYQNSSVTFQRSDSVVYSGNISGLGSVEQLGTGTLTLTGNNTYTGITNVLDGTLIIGTAGTYTGNAFAFGGTLQIGNGGTTGALSGNISMDTSQLRGSSGIRFNRSDDYVYSGNISGSGSITKLGAGRLTLTGNNTFSGSTTVSQGTLILASPTTYPGSLSVSSGATLQVGEGGTIGLIGTGVVNNGTIVFNRSDNITFSSSIQGPGTLVKLGAGSLTVISQLAYTGPTIISSGTLIVNNLSSSGVTNNGAFVINNPFGYTYPGAISGTGTFTKQGAGTLILSGNISYSGTTIISEGTLQLGTGSLTGSLNSNSVINNGNLIFNRAGNYAYFGAISGSGSLTKLTSGSLTLSGNSTYTGTTTISAGTLQIGNGSTSGSVVSNIINNGALRFNRSDDLTLPGLITGSGTITKLGAGTLTLAPGKSVPYQMSALTISAGSLNTSDNDLLINYTGTSPLATLTGYAANNQLLASPDFGGFSSLMVLFEASDLGLTEFSGVPIDSTTVIGKFTYAGDANLDGQVNSFDYTVVDDYFGQPGSFITGDLSGDGIVDSFDYPVIDDTFGAGVGNSLRTQAPSFSTEVFIPEPASVSLLAFTCLLLTRRRSA